MTPALALEGVSFRYAGGSPVLTEVTLAVQRGTVVALVGPSGSGKSTVLRLALGLERPEQGTILVDGVVASAAGAILVPPEERSLAIVFQDLALWPHLTVRSNLTFGLASRGVGRGERARRVEEGLSRVGLLEASGRFPGQLSGGERQRVAIARALVLEPRAILLDEPLANLDVLLRRELLATFRRLFAAQGVAVLHVTHDLREAAALADRIAVLEGGRIVQEGALDDLRTRPATELVRGLVAELP